MIAKKIVLATLGVSLLAGAALPAFAAPHDRGPGGRGPEAMGMGRHGAMQDVMFVRLLKAADTNKDGKVTKDEMDARRDALFTEIDANKDGMLSRGELLDYRQAKMDAFRKANPPPQVGNTADKQAPQPNDQAAGNAKPGDNANPDGNGKADDRMADRGHGRHHDREASGWDRRGERHGWGRENARWDRHGGERGMMPGGMFRMIDQDGDGKISKAEAAAASDKLFARMDTNKDGVISIDDLPDRPL